jgi:Sulfotransferase domain
MMKRLLPNAFIIGAPKCGTTSLWLYLREHPEVSFAREKEPDFFAWSDYREWLDWYQGLFEPAPIRIEASTSYSIYPVHAGVPEKIHSLVPDPRFIYVVRDPVERAISHYVEHFAHRKETSGIDAALMEADDARNPYRAASRYATQIKRYLSLFPETSLLVIEQDELRSRRDQTLERVFRFLSIDPDRGRPAEDIEVRRSDSRRRTGALASRLRETRAVGALVRGIWRLPPGTAMRVVGALKRPFSKPIERPALSPEVREALSAELAPEADWLREFTGKRFETWSC